MKQFNYCADYIYGGQTWVAVVSGNNARIPPFFWGEKKREEGGSSLLFPSIVVDGCTSGYAPWPRVMNIRGPTVERVSTTSSFSFVNFRPVRGDVRKRSTTQKKQKKVVPLRSSFASTRALGKVNKNLLVLYKLLRPACIYKNDHRETTTKYCATKLPIVTDRCA